LETTKQLRLMTTIHSLLFHFPIQV